MAYVIGSECIGVKDASCVLVCPVDCIHPTRDHSSYDQVEQLFIDPEACIDCGVCAVECPVNAIYSEEELPPQEWESIRRSAEFFERPVQSFLGRRGGEKGVEPHEPATSI